VNDLSLEEWAREEALRELARIARRLPFEDFERDVRPRLARLTPGRRELIEDTLESMIVADEG